MPDLDRSDLVFIAVALEGPDGYSQAGEDYAVDGVNAIVLQPLCPEELTHRLWEHLSQPARGIELRRNAMETAARFTWDAVIRKHLLPVIDAEPAVMQSPHPHLRPGPATRPTALYASVGGAEGVRIVRRTAGRLR